MKRSLLHEETCNRALAAVELCLDDNAIRCPVRVCLQLHHIRLENDILEQVIDAHTGLRRYRNTDDISAILLRDEVILHQLLLYLIRVCRRLIHLIDGYDDRCVGGLCVVDCFHGLRHDTIIRCDDEYSDIGRLCTTHTHRGEGFVARCIEEGDDSVFVIYIDLHLVSTDGLCDTTGLA